MAEHFLTKTRVEQSRLLETSEGPVLPRAAALRQVLEREAGPEAASLFAEPIMGKPNEAGDVAISWYTDIAGDPQRLSELDGPIRDDIEARLASRLQDLRRLLRSADLAPSIGAMLTIPDNRSIWAVGGQPVLTDWAITEPGAVSGDEARNAHHARTLGRFLPLANAAVVLSGREAAAGPAGDPAAPATAMAGEGPAPAAASPDVVSGLAASSDLGGGRPGGGAAPAMAAPTDAGPGRMAAIWPALVLSLVLAAALVWLLTPEARLFPPQASAVDTQIDERAINLARETNRALEERSLALEAALQSAVCTDRGEILLPDGRTPEGMLPPTADPDATGTAPDRAALTPREGRSTPLIPPNPSRVRMPGPDGTAPAQDGPSLLQAIEARTVLVLASAGDGTGVGTGFFIAPDLVATNHHVIADALSGGTIHVINRAFGTVREAQVLASDGPFESTGGDFALLRVPGANAEFFPVVPRGTELRAQGVIAAGFPMDIMQTDQRYRQLISGDTGSVPDMIVTDGIVNTVQQVADGIDMVVHSAPISRGNSGGPLIDMCGRVVGMNTFVREEAFRNLNLAQATGNLLGFLASANSGAEISDVPCVPRLAAPAPAADDARRTAPETAE